MPSLIQITSSVATNTLPVDGFGLRLSSRFWYWWWTWRFEVL